MSQSRVEITVERSYRDQRLEGPESVNKILVTLCLSLGLVRYGGYPSACALVPVPFHFVK